MANSQGRNMSRDAHIKEAHARAVRDMSACEIDGPLATQLRAARLANPKTHTHTYIETNRQTDSWD